MGVSLRCPFAKEDRILYFFQTVIDLFSRTRSFVGLFLGCSKNKLCANGHFRSVSRQ